MDAGRLLTATARQLFDYSLFNAHPRFFGYITAPAGANRHPRRLSRLGPECERRPVVTLAPAATEIEVQTVRWIAELIGFPADGDGLLVSGGNAANITCFVAARAAAATWDLRAEGVGGARGRQLVAYASTRSTHLDSEGGRHLRARHQCHPVD